jgi:multiple sugar transport system permease protein
MPRGEAQSLPPPLWPAEPTWENYRELFTRLNLGRYFLNSLGVSLAITASALLLNSMAGYAFAKLRFRGRDRLFTLLLAALVVPLQVVMLPLFLLLKELGLINTYWAVIIPSMATIYGIFLVRQYCLSIPDSLLDAARVDGAGEARVFFSIVLPLIRPVLVTLGIFTFLGAWNDFMWPLIVLTGNDRYTLPVALAILSSEHVQDAELMMAGSVVTMLPALALFAVLQRQLIGGIMMGGVKG